jgi:2-haloacid dehalogenase
LCCGRLHPALGVTTGCGDAAIGSAHTDQRLAGIGLGAEETKMDTDAGGRDGGPWGEQTALAPPPAFPHYGHPMRTYQGFLLDADNTLFDYDRGELEALTETIREFMPGVALEAAVASYRTINNGYWRRFEQGAVGLEELKPGRFRDLLAVLGAPGDPLEMSRQYLQRLAGKAYLLPHAREALEWLAPRAPLCLVTNGLSPVQRGRLAKAGITGLFRVLLISEEIGISKPDPAFFRRAAADLGLQPSEVLCVGDNPSTDVRGALAAGIDACWFSPGGDEWDLGDPRPTLVIHDLRELAPLAPGA